MRLNSNFILLIAVLVSLNIKNVLAGNTVVELLDFGTIVVINNDSIGQITVNLNGSTTVAGPIILLVPGQPAEIEFFGYPAYTPLSITSNVVTATTTIPFGSSEQFTLTSVNTLPSVTTDVLGTVIVTVGGTIQTSGVGVGVGEYLDTTYSATYEVIVNF